MKQIISISISLALITASATLLAQQPPATTKSIDIPSSSEHYSHRCPQCSPQHSHKNKISVYTKSHSVPLPEIIFELELDNKTFVPQDSKLFKSQDAKR